VKILIRTLASELSFCSAPLQLGEGVEVTVNFHHVRFGRGSTSRDYTVAILAYSTEELRGVARCSKDDHYCRVTGRRLALTRALVNVPRETRKLIWTGLMKKGVRFF